ncbi:MAG: hypothetical protein JWN21_1480 [Sphingomonas bacterium]|uniref:DUF983 domain-containing protein n=1 Tax=Sphingomonas bacterium TaxID=1895847 RepID=UPI00261A28E9|nr:DUF983 domain-containing protein [Sphingomonas bacterium]MDB5695937.1 hypothetical protein [Sphingomonas bacterium]
MAEPPLAHAALKGLCPRCGAKTLFAGWARFAPTCSTCGLEFSAFNVGDGPAAFLTLILGTIVMSMAIALELTVGPPLWVHLVLWTPITAVGVLGSLRIAKAALIAVEYRQRAAEGRLK